MERSMFRTAWWAPVIAGLCFVALAIAYFFNPLGAISTIVWMVGLFWLIGGAIKLLTLVFDRTQWGWKLLSGLCSVAVGGWIVFPSSMFQSTLNNVSVSMAFVGLWALLGMLVGASTLFGGIALKSGLETTLGVLEILFALLIVTNLLGAVVFIGSLYAFGVLMVGLVSIYVGLRARRMEKSIFSRQYHIHR